MKDNAVAKRYAQALFEIAQEKGKEEVFLKDFQELLVSLRGDEDFLKALNSRLLDIHIKKDLLKRIFAKELDPLFLNFLLLVVDKFREAYLQEIADAYESLVNEKNKVILAEVKSSQKLSQEQLTSLEAKFGKLTGKKVEFKETLDESLVGGLVIRVGDTVYDGSIARRLDLLQMHLQ